MTARLHGGASLREARRRVQAHLERSGEVDELKARVRACVAKAVLENGAEEDRNEEEEEEEEVRAAAALIEEFLRYYGMEHARGVFAVERRVRLGRQKRTCGTPPAPRDEKEEKAMPELITLLQSTRQRGAQAVPLSTSTGESVARTTTLEVVHELATVDLPPSAPPEPAVFVPVEPVAVVAEKATQQHEEEEEEDVDAELEEVSEDLGCSTSEKDDDNDDYEQYSSDASSTSDAPSGVLLSDRSGPIDTLGDIDLITHL